MQGIALPKLRWRWAAMNPCSSDQSSVQDYVGSEPLDPALADRFALFVTARRLGGPDRGRAPRRRRPERRGPHRQRRRRAAQGGRRLARASSSSACRRCRRLVIAYAVAVDDGAQRRRHPHLAAARAPPRAQPSRRHHRRRQDEASRLFRSVLGCSLPHACWGEQPTAEAIAAAHRAAWDSASHASEAWVHSFLTEARLDRKLALLLDNAKTRGRRLAGDRAVPRWRRPRSAPAPSPSPSTRRRRCGKLPIGAEGVNDLAKVAAPILSVEGELTWSERYNEKNTSHPEVARIAKALAGLKGARAERAQQFFSWCMVSKLLPARPADLETRDRGLRRGAAQAGVRMMRPGIDYCPGARANQRHANTGGPMSRTRREVICSTLLGNDERLDPLPAHRPSGNRVSQRRPGGAGHGAPARRRASQHRRTCSTSSTSPSSGWSPARTRRRRAPSTSRTTLRATCSGTR